MKELTKTRRLSIATILFILILVVGFITFQKPDFEYKITPEESLSELNNPNNEIAPEAMKKLISNDENSTVLIDLRNPYQYNRGTLEDAINIPVSDILDKDIIAMFDDLQNKGTTVILFATDQQEANAPWMVLRQLGYKNMKVLMGGYNYSAKLKKGGEVSSKTTYLAEKPVMDFASFIENISGSKIKETMANQPEQIITIPRQKKTTTAGGC